MTTTTTAVPERSFASKLLRRAGIAIALIVLMLLPSVILFAITKQPSATYASMGALIGIIAVAAGSVRIGVITAVVVSLLAPITIVAGLSPITGAAVMALMTLTVGRLATFGLHRAVVLVPIMLAWPMLTPIPWIPSSLHDKVQDELTSKGLTLNEAVAHLQSGSSSGSAGGSSSASSSMTTKITDALLHQRMDSTYLAWIAAFFFIGTIFAVGATWFVMRKRPAPTLAGHPRSETVPYTIAITLLATVATWYCLDHPKLVAGSFLVASILVLTQLGNDIAWKLTIERVLGTFAGMALLVGIMKLLGSVTYTDVLGVPLPMKIYLIGIVFGVLAVMAKFSPRLWIYYVFIVPTAAMLNAFTAAQATDLGKQRAVDNAVGAGLVIIAALVTLIGSRVMNHSHSDTDATPTPSPA